MKQIKVIYCKQIYTAQSPELIDGYLVIRDNFIDKIVPAKDWVACSTLYTGIKILDYSNEFLMPAFHDYHVHMAMAAMMEYFGTVRTAASEEEAAKILYQKNMDKDPDQWILGGAWDHFIWPEQKLPSKESLDKYFPNTPVFALNKECHGAWLNSKALKKFGIVKDTPDPPHGQYFRDADGNPTGYVHELAIGPMLQKIFDEISDKEIVKFMKAFAKMASSLGIISVGDLPLHGIVREDVYRIIREQEDFQLRIHFSTALQESNDKILELAEEFKGPIICFNGVKDFLDGTPMGYTGYLIEPYSDRPDFTSESILPAEELFRRVAELDRYNIKVRLHCCGDGAVRLALDAFEYAGKKNGFRDLRHAIEHIEVIAPEDIGRFAKLGVIASVQPEHIPRTHFNTHPFHRLLGEERMKYAWPFQSLTNAGAQLAFGTDYPVVDFTPFKGLFRAVNRLTNELEPEGGFNPWEKLSVHHALRNYTFGSAYACNREKELGTLEKGKLADITILGKNPFAVIGDKDTMFGMDVKMTMMNGNIVFEE